MGEDLRRLDTYLHTDIRTYAYTYGHLMGPGEIPGTTCLRSLFAYMFTKHAECRLKYAGHRVGALDSCESFHSLRLGV